MPAKITVRFDVEHPLFFISNTFILLRWLNFVFRRINRLCDRKKSEKKMKKKLETDNMCYLWYFLEFSFDFWIKWNINQLWM